MLERILLLLALAALLFASIVLVKGWTRARKRRLLAQTPEPLWASLGMQPDGRPTLVAFSTPSCAACHTAQTPVVRLVEQEIGPASLRVVSVDLTRQPAVARAFGVLTVPSTVVLGSTGRVLAVNHGFAPSDRLSAQLSAAQR
jgi:thioredoxin-like negative regulator of GroEL